jgi:hypothetical protein
MGVPLVRRHLAWICCLGLAAVGCGDSSRPVTQENMLETSLNDVGNIYRAFVVAHHKPPKTLKDLATLERMSPAGVVAVRSGKVVVRFGAELPDTDPEPGQSSSDQVLAYDTQVPESGGKVLMLDRTIRTMTAEEFKSAPKAGDR